MRREDRDKVISVLRRKGISPSPQRVEIYGFLAANAIHPPAEVIWKAVKTEIPGISLTTVYNTLKLLRGKGLINEVLIEDGELRYDADISGHGHFKCIGCGEITDIFPENGSELIPELPALPEGYVVEETHLCLRGHCPGCRAAEMA